MKKMLLSLLIISFSSFAGMNGHWESKSSSSTFILDLVQVERHITGKYCFITNNGNRIDCAESDDDDNIYGVIKNGVAKVQFESTFGGVGQAIMQIKNGKLEYKVSNKTPFIQANMSVPDDIEFSKK